MKYTINVHRYPEEFIVEASSETEAKEKAKELFYSKNNNGSVYEVEVTDTELSND